jgi:hypothetical protein
MLSVDHGAGLYPKGMIYNLNAEFVGLLTVLAINHSANAIL